MVKIKLNDGRGEVDLRFCREDTDRHGNVRLFARVGSQSVRLREAPGTAAFFEEHRRALEALRSGVANKDLKTSTAIDPKSFRAACVGYYASAPFKQLDGRTQHIRRRMLDLFCEKNGTLPIALMQPHHVAAFRDAKAGAPESANSLVKAMRQVFTYAVGARLARNNAAKEVSYIRTGSAGFHTWSVDEVRKFEERHSVGSRPRLALGLMLYAGVRRSDAVTLGRQHVRDGWFSFVPVKNRKKNREPLQIPILPELQALIDKTPSGNLTFLVTAFGRPFTANGFGGWFRRRCDEAGLPHCSAHGLRKAGATIAAENGATEHQLMAIFGWATPKEAARYTKAASRKTLAAAGMHLLVHQTQNETVPLSPVMQSGGTKSGAK